MGYYENPPIIQPSRGSEIISASITNAASSIAQGIINAGERRRKEEKERKLTLQKLQDRKNETDLYYNEKYLIGLLSNLPLVTLLTNKYII